MNVTLPLGGSNRPALLDGGSNRPLRLDDPARAWVMHAGYADVFCVEASTRRHLFRVEQGVWLFGLAPAAGLDLIAVGSLGSLFRQERVAAALDEPRAIERWVQLLTNAVEGIERTWPDLVLDGSSQVIEPGQRAGAPPRDLLWLQVEEGTPRWIGQVPIAMGAILPLVAPSWLDTVDGPARLHAAGEDELQGRGGIETALAGFNAMALTVLANRYSAMRAEEARLAADRVHKADAEMSAAMLRLGGVAAAGHEGPLPNDPTLATLTILCRAIGHAKALPRTLPAIHDPAARLAAVLAAAELYARPVILAPGWWRRDGLPLLARLDDGPLVALLPAGGRWRLRGAGMDRRIDAALAARLSGGRQLYPALPARPLKLTDLVHLASRGVGGDLRRVALMGACAAILGLGTPIATGLLFEDVVPLGNRDGLLQIVGGLVAITIGATAFELVKAFALLRFESRLDANMQAAVVSRLLRLPTRFFRGFSAGDLAKRTLGLQEARLILTGTALTAVLGGVFSLVSLVVMLEEDWRLALVAMGPVTLLILVIAGLAYGQLRHERERTRLAGRIDGFVLQLMIGINKLRTSAAEKRAITEWADRDVLLRREVVSVQRFAAGQACAKALLPPLALVVLYGAAAHFLKSDLAQSLGDAIRPAGGAPLSAASFAAFSAAFGQLTAGLTGAALAVTHLLAAVPLLERVRPLLQTAPEAAPEGEAPDALTGRIEMRRVTFRYDPDAPPVLRDLSLKIEAGEFVAVVGASGSGKSTVLRLLLGFERPEAGDIYYDGRSAERMDRVALRNQIGVVLQNGRIIPGSIYENILGTPGLGLDDAWAAARLVNLADDIEAMPMGMHTVLNDGGQALSGGQRQRILLARALVRRPKIVLLDEATSALDNRTQAIVTDTIAALSVTRVVIAHRLTTIRGVSRVMVMEAGRVVESGGYEELMNKGGAFAALVRRQLL